jgi:1-deoxy-D-xylulose-5-phosphate reductoisomerase
VAAARVGGTAPTVLSAANEIAVSAFLARRLSFGGIADMIAAALDAIAPRPATGIEEIRDADRATRAWIRDHYATATTGDGR